METVISGPPQRFHSLRQVDAPSQGARRLLPVQVACFPAEAVGPGPCSRRHHGGERGHRGCPAGAGSALFVEMWSSEAASAWAGVGLCHLHIMSRLLHHCRSLFASRQVGMHVYQLHGGKAGHLFGRHGMVVQRPSSQVPMSHCSRKSAEHTATVARKKGDSTAGFQQTKQVEGCSKLVWFDGSMSLPVLLGKALHGWSIPEVGACSTHLQCPYASSAP